MTRGHQLAAAGALLCVLAAGFSVPALYVPGISLVLVGLVAPLWVTRAAAGTRLHLEVSDALLQEDERVTLALRVARGAWPLPGATLSLDAPAQPVTVPGRRGGGHVALSVAMHRRGRWPLGPARLRLADPLGVRACDVVSRPCEVLVLPRVYPVSADAGGELDSGRRRHVAPTDATEIDSLRPYRPGAPASRIHWPTVARTGILLEHRLVAETDQRPLVVLDARRVESDEALDRAVRAAASLCVHLAGRGGCGLLLPGDRRAASIDADLRGWPTQHVRLALVQPGHAAPSPGVIARAGMLIYVTAAAPGAVTIPSGCLRVGPHPLTGPPVRFSIAGCSAQAIAATAGVRVA